MLSASPATCPLLVVILLHHDGLSLLEPMETALPVTGTGVCKGGREKVRGFVWLPKRDRGPALNSVTEWLLASCLWKVSEPFQHGPL